MKCKRMKLLIKREIHPNVVISIYKDDRGLMRIFLKDKAGLGSNAFLFRQYWKAIYDAEEKMLEEY